MSLAVGTQVERYVVHDLIGAGAMGDVYLAVDHALGRKVALKILSEAHRENPELRARFVREARAVAAISHPNVVQVFTTGEFDGRPYFAMEYLAGRDLGTIVRDDGPLPPRMAAANLLDAARGLEAAAHAGLVHRDVKPSNLVRLDTGPVKVTDFGLVKPAISTEDPALTALGVVVGTPDYIAPEQARGEEIDWRVDIYALGCTLYYLVTGRPPFRRGTEHEDKYLKVVARHLREPAPDLRKERPGVDDGLAELALAMMRKNPEQRPSYGEVIERLAALASRSLGTAPVLSAGVSSEPRAAPRPRGRWLGLVTALSALVLFVGVGLTLFAPRAAPGAASGDGGPGIADAAPPQRADAGATSAPAGMVVVRDATGRAVLYVERYAVTNRAYAEIVKSHSYASGDAERPVTGISFENANKYAKLRGRRLLRALEWDEALNTLGFIPAGMRTWEWVDEGHPEAKAQIVRRAPDDAGRRRASGDKDVTFRLALDP